MIITPAAYYNPVLSYPLPHMKIQSTATLKRSQHAWHYTNESPAWQMKYLCFSNYASLEVTEQVNKLKNRRNSLQSGSSPPLHYLLLFCCLGMHKLTILSYVQRAKLMVLFLSSALKTPIHPSKPSSNVTIQADFLTSPRLPRKLVLRTTMVLNALHYGLLSIHLSLAPKSLQEDYLTFRPPTRMCSFLWVPLHRVLKGRYQYYYWYVFLSLPFLLW